MTTRSCIQIAVVLLAGCTWASATMTPEQVSALPPPVDHAVDFSEEVRPILEASCTKCHGRGKDKGGFRIDTRQTFLQGGDSGAAVVSGRSHESLLIELVMGFDPDSMMPQKGSKLTPEQISVLRAWIDQGLKWDEGVSFAKPPPVNLWPVEPVLPVGPEALASRNAIDMILEHYYAENGFQPGPLVDDRTFARRVYLDVIGLLPTPEELDALLQDRLPDKRARLVRRLLADNQQYAVHWLTFWNDLLRNDYKGTGYIDGGRKQITAWLYESLATNKPYDRFVSELINPTPESEGFSKGIVWRGVVNASQRPPLQAAQSISQVFMGVNLKCASCHDSFINDWTLADAYGLASVYADEALEMVQCDKPTGHVAETKFIYGELGNIDPGLPKPERLKRLAEIMTQRDNARLTRTIVNRLWARFMGRGLVEPLDDMEREASLPELLDWLAADVAANGYDLKKTIAHILTSRAYQLPSVPAEERMSEYVFRGPTVRRMSAEQFTDAVASVTGVWPREPVAKANFFTGKERAGMSISETSWIWSRANAEKEAEPGAAYFRKQFTLESEPSAASLTIACDNGFRLFVNGEEAGSGRDHTEPSLIDIRPHLATGRNVIAIEAVNAPGRRGEEGEESSPAGLLCYVRIRMESDGESKEIELVSDSSWLCATNLTEGWAAKEFTTEGWRSAVALGPAGMEPWNLEKKFTQVASKDEVFDRVRAALITADPLMIALGRPNREQVVTRRASVATTLQCLELTNGQTLAEGLRKGTEKLLIDESRTTRELVTLIYKQALGREPTSEELRLAENLVGSPASPEGTEDLLWAIVMLPEFQLIF